MSEMWGVGASSGQAQWFYGTLAARPAAPPVPQDEVENLEIKLDALANLLQEAKQATGKPIGSRYAGQAAKEAKRIEEMAYQLIPATGVLPSELPLPIGVPSDVVHPLNHISPDDLRPVASRLPDELIPQSGVLMDRVIPNPRELPDELKSRVATAYTQFNQLLRESGLGQALRTNGVTKWIDSFSRP